LPITADIEADVDAGSDTNWKFDAGSLADQDMWALQLINSPAKPVVEVVLFGSWVGVPVAVQLTVNDIVAGIARIGGLSSPSALARLV
jgi:hypothetical protein